MKKIFNFLIEGILSILSLPLRPHGKRILVLTTVYMQLTHLQNYNKEKMLKLNASLHLVRSEDALEFPCFLNKVIWGPGIPAIDRISEEEVAASYLFTLTPKYLRYNREQMIEDFKKVIRNVGVINNAAHA
jgi:hypothetical protein